MVGRTNEEIKLELVAYSVREHLVQARINGLLTEFTILGNAQVVVERMQKLIRFRNTIAALSVLREYQAPRTRMRTDTFDTLVPTRTLERVKNL